MSLFFLLHFNCDEAALFSLDDHVKILFYVTQQIMLTTIKNIVNIQEDEMLNTDARIVNHAIN